MINLLFKTLLIAVLYTVSAQAQVYPPDAPVIEPGLYQLFFILWFMMSVATLIILFTANLTKVASARENIRLRLTSPEDLLIAVVGGGATVSFLFLDLVRPYAWVFIGAIILMASLLPIVPQQLRPLKTTTPLKATATRLPGAARTGASGSKKLVCKAGKTLHAFGAWYASFIDKRTENLRALQRLEQKSRDNASIGLILFALGLSGTVWAIFASPVLFGRIVQRVFAWHTKRLAPALWNRRAVEVNNELVRTAYKDHWKVRKQKGTYDLLLDRTRVPPYLWSWMRAWVWPVTPRDPSTIADCVLRIMEAETAVVPVPAVEAKSVKREVVKSAPKPVTKTERAQKPIVIKPEQTPAPPKPKVVAREPKPAPEKFIRVRPKTPGPSVTAMIREKAISLLPKKKPRKPRFVYRVT